MKKTNLHEAKTSLSKLVDLASKGEEVIICKAGNPVAKLVAYKPDKINRKPGSWKGKVRIKKDFDTLPEEFMRNFK
ncbi:antitoxin [candidate division TM6 bacterium RIFCSPHIGHO2_12_FULL_36_22]|nr:MAG: antitoxin [candidate division TM6 bacterium RIFCSPHIGHO2_12_FULL_36_22]